MKIFVRFIQLIVFLFSINNYAQTVITKSDIVFYDKSFDNFYSSFSIDSTQIYFIANDYYLHAIDKKTSKTNWSHYLANKTNTTPKVYKNNVFATKHVSEYQNVCIQLNKKTGDTIQSLLISKIETEPYFKDNSMFCTAINDEIGGVIMGYDLNKNAILWQQFIAHGVSKQPCFFKDKIVVNVEANNWLEIGYDGVLKDTTCKNKTAIFVENIPCVKNYEVLTHDEKQLDNSFLIKNLGEYEQIIQKSDSKITVLMSFEKLLILGKNKKILQKLNLSEIIVPSEIESNDYKDIIKIEENLVWFFYSNHLVCYDYKNNKSTKMYDLSKFKVHQLQLELDNSSAWLISKNDGQLYNIQLDN